MALDLPLRAIKERALRPVAERLAGRVSATALSVAALLLSVGAAGAAAASWWWVGLGGWLLGRLCDGLDGPVARATGTASDFGGYLDIVFDHIGYAALPVGVAVGVHHRSAWIAVAALEAVFFVNTISWAYLSAVLEKRGAGASTRGEMTTVTMPPALVEGTETIVLFALFLTFPPWATPLFTVMAALVAVNVGQRLIWARGAL